MISSFLRAARSITQKDVKQNGQVRHKKRWLLAGFILVFLSGWWATVYFGEVRDKEEREDRLNSVKVAAAMLSPAAIKSLSGDPRDLENPNYKFIQGQFLRILLGRPDTLYVYLFGRKDGKNIFLVDSERPGQKYSPEPVAVPGQVYEEDAELLKNLFSSGGAVTVGPEKDKWGTFISSLMAVRDPADGRVIAVIGFDYDARDWAMMIARHRSIPILITLLIDLLLVVFFIIYWREREIKEDVLARESRMQRLMSQLETEGRNLEILFNSTQVGLLLVNSKLDVTRLNNVVLNMAGRENPEVIGRRIGNVLNCLQVKEGDGQCGGSPACKGCLVRDMANTVLHSGKNIRDAEVLYTICPPDGEPRSLWLEVNASRIDIDGDKHILFSIVNITGRKASEDAMAQMKARLIQSDKLSSLGEMATGMAHEMNQPLGGIALVATCFRKFLEKKVLTEDKLSDGIRDIETNIKRMSQTIDHLRIYARQEKLEFRQVNVAATIDAALILMGAQLKAHGISLEMAVAPGLPVIKGEPHQLEQVWINFISNARDSMDEKGKQIKSRASGISEYEKELHISVAHDKGANMVIVSFADNGMGLSDVNAGKVFEPFFTTKGAGKGTGLGLSISHGIITSHQGKIEIEGQEGVGAMLRVSLPVASV